LQIRNKGLSLCMKRIFHPYHLWEDYINGMWRTVSKDLEAEILPLAIEFTGDHKLYGAAMLQVVEQWPYSCEHNLTNTSINRKAWLGHAACCLKHGWPEYLVRQAWHELTQKQQDDANAQAAKTIRIFESQYRIQCRKHILELTF